MISADAKRVLYRMAGDAGLTIAVLTMITIIVFIAWPPPHDGTVLAWFELFHDNWFLGLLSMDLLLIGVLLLEILVLIALFVALQESNWTLMAIALAVGLVGVALHLSSITAFEMLTLSERYAAAETDLERSQLLAAGEATLATYEGTAFQLNYLFGGTVVPLIVSAVMLRSLVFSRMTAYVGIGASIINLGLYVPAIGLTLSVFAGAAFWIWYVMVAVRFYGLPGTLPPSTIQRKVSRMEADPRSLR
jgi:hypothetical protein